MQILINNRNIIIDDVFSLEKLGAGDDGKVYRFGDTALKLVKYSDLERAKKGSMTIEKLNLFLDKLKTTSIISPSDTLFSMNEEDEKFSFYSGYAMPCRLPSTCKFNQIYCSEFLTFMELLFEDFKLLTSINVAAKDINAGSYIFSDERLYLCDTDKYLIVSHLIAEELNRFAFNYAILRWLYINYCLIFYSIDDQERRRINRLIREITNRSDVFKIVSTDLKKYAGLRMKDYFQNENIFSLKRN